MREYFNQWQLAASLTDHFNTWVSGVRPGAELVQFAGMNFLPPLWKSEIKTKCPFLPTPTAEKAKQFSLAYIRGHTPEGDEIPRGELITLSKLGGLQSKLDKGIITEDEFNKQLAQYLYQ